MDASRVRRGEMIAGVAAVALLLIMFIFDWFSVDLGVAGDLVGVDAGANAWQAFDFIDIVLFVTVIVAIGLALAAASATSVNLPVAASALTAGLGILSVILIVYRIIDPPGEGGVDRDIGVFLGLIAAAGVAYGGWISMQEEGTTFSGQADRLQERMGSPEPPEPGPSEPGPSDRESGGPPPPPPPPSS